VSGLKHLLKATNLKPHQAHPNQLESISIQFKPDYYKNNNVSFHHVVALPHISIPIRSDSIQFKPDYYKNNNVSFHHVVALPHISIPIRSNSIQFKSVLILWRFNITDNESTNYRLKSFIYSLFTTLYLIHHNDCGRTRTCNPHIRSMVPYPLGHTVLIVIDAYSTIYLLLPINVSS
jgi:hypothetical protein